MQSKFKGMFKLVIRKDHPEDLEFANKLARKHFSTNSDFFLEVWNDVDHPIKIQGKPPAPELYIDFSSRVVHGRDNISKYLDGFFKIGVKNEQKKS